MRRVQVDESTDWRILLDVTRIDRVDPWRVDLLRLLREMEREVEADAVNIVYAGVALFSAALIHRIKSERILVWDRPPEPRERPVLVVPPPIDVPVKSSVVAATLMDVVESLRRVLLSISRQEQRGSIIDQINTDIKIDDYLLKIEEQVEEFIEMLETMLINREFMTFRELISNVDRLEAARRFILVLFAASRGKVELLQDEETLEILIRPLRPGLAAG